ncbi:MAG: prepilin-type N-terminal cleavage/methylation domain-containing protein [Holosporales bacterium]|jgi:prepilin-type N-terminal cleavage/methylation domain-containing protein|nr:prepilin-type N-terminal cleavage/methylation domain-containing protein [Holosporales bacterium]
MKRYLEGFSLIEVSISLLIVGIISTICVSQLSSYLSIERLRKTESHCDIVVNSIGAYAKIKGTLPSATNIDSSNGFGIVPFETLGIMEKFVKDGYGNWFLYKTNPDFNKTTSSNKTLGISGFKGITNDMVAFIIKSVNPKTGSEIYSVWYSKINFQSMFPARKNTIPSSVID